MVKTLEVSKLPELKKEYLLDQFNNFASKEIFNGIKDKIKEKDLIGVTGELHNGWKIKKKTNRNSSIINQSVSVGAIQKGVYATAIQVLKGGQ